MQRIKTLLVLLGVWALLNGSTTSTVSAQVFNSQLMAPNGISTEASGNVNIHSDGIATTLLTKFAPDGSQLTRTAVWRPIRSSIASTCCLLKETS